MYRHTRDNTDWEGYRQLKDIINSKTCNAKSDLYKECLICESKNPKQFWNKIKTIINSSVKNSIDKIRVTNKTLNKPACIGKAFNQHFSSVCSTLLPDIIHLLQY